MKNKNKLIPLLLAVIFCFAGCDRNDTPLANNLSSPNSSPNSALDSSMEEATSSNSSSYSAPDSSAEETSSPDSEISNDYVNIDTLVYDDFTEDDLWLQSFLKENYPMALFLMRTYCDNFYEPEYKDNTDAEHKSKYMLDYAGIDQPYFIVPNTYFNNFEEYQAMRDKYFSSNISKVEKVYADIVDAENDRIALRDHSEPYYPQLIEINGRLYHVACAMGSGYPPRLDMAKVITKTDNEIVFSYLCHIDNLGNGWAGKGVLKKENDVWKFGWFYVHKPIEFLDIHEVWGI